MVNETLINATSEVMELVNNSLINISSTSKSGILHSLINNPPLLVFILSVLTVIVILIVVVRNVIPVSHFLYANARTQARTNYMVKDSLLMELIEAKSLKEFRSLLKETIYGEEVEKAGEGLWGFHAALEKGFIGAVLELIELNPEKSKKLFDAYLMFFEVKILKIIYRAKLMGIKLGEGMVYSIGNINENLLNHLMGTETVADIKVVMEPTIYAKIFEKEYPSLEDFEVDIDEFVFNNFVGVVEKTKMYDGNYIVDILNKKVDILNVLALLKFRVRGVEKEKQKDMLIDNKTQLCLRFDKLIEAETLKDFVEGFNGLPYHGALVKAFENYEKDNSLVHFENELYRFFKEFVVGNELSHTLGPYPLFSYLIKMELEQRNLFVISRGIDAGFSAEKIKEMII